MLAKKRDRCVIAALAVFSFLFLSGFVPYTSDTNTILIDHFDGTTSASILAYREDGVPCGSYGGSPKPSATPVSAYVTGPSGLSQALSLNPPVGEPAGSGTYLKYPGQLLSQSNGTIEFWVYLTTYGSGLTLVQQGPFPGSCAGWTFGMGVNAIGQLQAGAWAAFNMDSGAYTVPLNAWTHVAATWGSTGAKLYINGVMVGSSANTGMPASGYSGNVLVNYGARDVGTRIDEIRISNIQRTTFQSSGGATVIISGVVKDWSDNVIPTPGVTVSLVGGSQTTTTSTTDGTFSLSDVPVNTQFSLKFSGSGYLDVYTVNIGPLTSDMNVSADSYGGFFPISMPMASDLTAFGAMPGSNKTVIAGRVRDNTYRSSSYVGGVVVTATGNGSKNYPVTYRDPFGILSGSATYTYGNGRYYVLNVDDGDTVTVTASKTGWTFNPRTFQAHGNAVSQGQIWGTAPGYDASLSGFVQTLGGNGVSGARIELNGDPGKYTLSGGVGSFTFSGLPKDTTSYVKVTATNYVPTYSAVIGLPGNVSGVTLLLVTPAEMTGYGVGPGKGLMGCFVIDQNMNPLSGATVVLTSKTGTTYTVNYLGGNGLTSASGRFLVPDIIPGDAVKIDVTKDGYTFYSAYLDGFADSASGRYIVGIPTAIGTVTVSGFVKDWNDALIPTTGVTVSLVENPAKTTTTSTTDGSFSLAGVPANTPFSLKFSRSGYLDVYTVDITTSTGGNICIDANGGVAPINMPTSGDLIAFGAQPDSGKALIWGRVVDQNYRYTTSVGGAVVTAQGSSVTYPVKYRNPFGVLEDTPGTWGNGRYYVLNVNSADTVTVTAAKAGWTFSPRTFHTHGDAVSQGRIFGTAPGYDASISGFVKNFSGTTGIVGARLEVNGAVNKFTTSTTGGAYTFGGLPRDANFYVKVTATGYVPAYAGPVNLQGSASGIEILMATAAEMTAYGVTGSNGLIGCTVRDSSMNPLSGATVSLTSKSGTGYSVFYEGLGIATNATGKFIIPNIQPGDVVKIDVTKAGYTFSSTYMDGFTGSITEKNIIGTAAPIQAMAYTGYQVKTPDPDLYSAYFIVRDPADAIDTVTVMGVGLGSPATLFHDAANHQWQSWDPMGIEASVTVNFGSTPPVGLPYTYTFEIKTKLGTTTTQTAQISQFVTVTPSSMSPAANSNLTGTPTFTWTSVGGSYGYYVRIYDSSGNQVWFKNSPFATTVTYDGQALTPGNYSYSVFVSDSNGNFSRVTIPFNIAASGNAFLIGTSTYGNMGASAAFDGTNYLVGMEEGVNPHDTQTAQFISQSGTLIGSRIYTGRLGGMPMIGFNGTNYLMVWEDDYEDTDPAPISTHTMYGKLISPSGTEVKAPFAISASVGPPPWENGPVICNSTKCTVVWSVRDSHGTVYGRDISPPDGSFLTDVYTLFTDPRPDIGRVSAGAMYDSGGNYLVAIDTGSKILASIKGPAINKSPFEIATKAPTGTCNDQNPVGIAFDGTNYLVVWNDHSDCTAVPAWDVLAQRIDTSGNLVGTAFKVNSTNTWRAALPSIGFDGTNYLVAWTDGRNDADRDGVCDPGEGTCDDIYGQFVSKSGALSGSEFIINNDAGNQIGLVTGFNAGKYLVLVNTGISRSGSGGLSGGSVYGLFLSPSSTVSGIVRDWNGAVIPTPGVTVTLVGSDPAKTTTTSTTDGSFSLSGMPANTPLSLKFSKTGYLDVYTVDFSPSANVNISADAYGGFIPINMPTASDLTAFGAMPASSKAIITGRVRDNTYRSSNYVSGVVVTATGNGSKNYPVTYRDPFGSLSSTPSTWGNGRYYVLNVDDGDTVTVTASKAGWTFNPRTFHTHGNALSQGQIWGNAPGYDVSISGVVGDWVTHGAIPGAHIELNGDPGKYTEAAGDGSYIFSGLPDATFYAKITASGYVTTYAGPTSLGGSVSGIIYPMLTSAAMTGYGVTSGNGIILCAVVDRAGNLLSGATVTVTSKLSQTYTVMYDGGGSATSSSGRFYVPNIVPGDVVKIDATLAGHTFPSYYPDSFAPYVTAKYIRGASLDETLIQNMLAAGIAAYNNKNIDTLMSYFAAAYLNDGMTKDMQRAEFVKEFAGSPTPLPTTATNIVVNGNSATAYIAGGPGTFYLMKTDGNWLINGNQKKYGIIAFSGHSKSGGNDQYWAEIIVKDPGSAIQSVNVTGTGISGTLALHYDSNQLMWESWTNGNPVFGSTKPATLPAYTLTITEKTTSSVIETVTVTGFIDVFITNPSPSSGSTVTGPLTFSWTGAAGSYTYGVELNDASYNRIWGKNNLTGTSVTYDGPALTPGSYNYNILVRDADGNMSMVQVPFTYSSTASTVTISGVVMDWGGNNVISSPGVTVSLVGGSQTTTSTTDGSFSLAGVPANTTFSLKFSRTGYLDVYSRDMSYSSNSNISTYTTGVVPFYMPTESDLTAFGAMPAFGKAVIHGRVTDNTYKSSSKVGGAVVTAQGLTKSYPVFYRDPFGVLSRTQSTWGNGHYYVLNVDDGDTVTVTAAKAGWTFNPRTFHTHWNALSQARILGTAPGYDVSLSGLVKTLGGSAITGARLELSGDTGKFTTSTTGGAYTFGGLPRDANFYVKVTAAGYVPAYAGPVNLQGSASGIEIVMATAAEMTAYGVTGSNGLIGCTVRDQSMNPLSGATVSLTSKSGTVYTVFYEGFGSATNATGKFIIPNIQPGDVVKIDVTKAGYTFPSTYMDGFAGSITERNIIGGNAIVGTWAAAALHYENAPGVWYSEASGITFNANGTGTVAGIKNDGINTAGQRIIPVNETFTYTITPNADGSYALALNFSGDIKNRRLVLSDNGNMAVMDGTDSSAREKLDVLAKIDTARTYSNADLNGEYYFLGFERNADNVADPPNGNGSYMAISGIQTFNGAGLYNYYGKANSVTTGGANVIWDDTGKTNQPYAVSANGGITVGGGAFRGAITGNGKILGGTGSYSSNNWLAYSFMKKGDKTYATADLAGKWAVVGFGQDNKTAAPSMSFAAEIGTIICDNAGACSFKFKRLRSDGNVGVDTGNVTFSVAADGSFGGSITSGAPAYAGAIGNNGNTIMFNVSFDPAQIYHREIFIGVRANNIGDLAGGTPFLRGDINGDGNVTLADAILAIKVVAGMNPPGIRTNYSTSGTDVNDDGMVGPSEMVYILQAVAGLR